MMSVNALTSDQCCGCAACMNKCAAHAIVMKEDENGNRRAIVDETLCVRCGLCTQVCPHFYITGPSSFDKRTFVAFAHDKRLAEKSSSGGIFAILAQYVIRQGGVVYGAAMIYENDILLCKHIRIDSMQDLPLLQGSKYVQSRTDGIFTKVKKDLSEGRLVLFSGTSCQVDSLKHFVSDHNLLFTVDLVCHGVPKDTLFRNYISYLEKKSKSKIVDVSFRSKSQKHLGKEERYGVFLTCSYKGRVFSRTIHNERSSYLNMFLNRAGYRDSCYHCAYASLQKPADLTLGDFIPKTEEIQRYHFNPIEHHSSIIVNNERGMGVLNELSDELEMVEIPIKKMLNHHHNLKAPSQITEKGKQLFHTYKMKGYEGLQVILIIISIKAKIKFAIKYLLYKR